MRTFNSATLLTTNFLKFFWSLQRFWSAFLVPYPMEGIRVWPLKRRRTRESIPFGFLHDWSTRSNRSDPYAIHWVRYQEGRPEPLP